MPRRAKLGEVGRVDRVAVADPAVDRQAEARRVTRAAVGCDDDRDAIGPARPGRVERRTLGHVAIREDDRPATARRPVAGISRAAHAPAGGAATRYPSTQATTDGATSAAPAARSSSGSPITDLMPTARTPTARAISMSVGASPT